MGVYVKQFLFVKFTFFCYECVVFARVISTDLNFGIFANTHFYEGIFLIGFALYPIFLSRTHTHTDYLFIYGVLQFNFSPFDTIYQQQRERVKKNHRNKFLISTFFSLLLGSYASHFNIDSKKKSKRYQLKTSQ